MLSSWILRAPLVHFLLLGALLFAADALRRAEAPDEASPDRRIALDDDALAELHGNFVRSAGRPPSEAELARLVEARVEEEILYREALARGLLERDGGVQTRLIQKMLFLEGGAGIEQAPALLERARALGLHEDDVVVRRILVQKMRLLGSTLSPEERPSEAEVREAYHREREALRMPDRVDLRHAFLSADRRGEALARDAAQLRTRLLAEPDPGSRTLGDPFPLGHQLTGRSQDDLTRSFGGDFGARVFALEPGAWSEPIASAYGLHLVRVDARAKGRVPPFEAVAERLRLELEQVRREARLDALLSDLRSRYEVVLPTRSPDQETG